MKIGIQNALTPANEYSEEIKILKGIVDLKPRQSMYIKLKLTLEDSSTQKKIRGFALEEKVVKYQKAGN